MYKINISHSINSFIRITSNTNMSLWTPNDNWLNFFGSGCCMFPFRGEPRCQPGWTQPGMIYSRVKHIPFCVKGLTIPEKGDSENKSGPRTALHSLFCLLHWNSSFIVHHYYSIMLMIHTETHSFACFCIDCKHRTSYWVSSSGLFVYWSCTCNYIEHTKYTYTLSYLL